MPLSTTVQAYELEMPLAVCWGDMPVMALDVSYTPPCCITIT